MKMWEVYGTFKGEKVSVRVWAPTYGRAFVEALNAYPELVADRAFRVDSQPRY